MPAAIASSSAANAIVAMAGGALPEQRVTPPKWQLPLAEQPVGLPEWPSLPRNAITSSDSTAGEHSA